MDKSNQPDNGIQKLMSASEWQQKYHAGQSFTHKLIDMYAAYVTEQKQAEIDRLKEENVAAFNTGWNARGEREREQRESDIEDARYNARYRNQ